MNIILTGIIRSGTTLTCSLLNKLPQCVALHEPMNPDKLLYSDYPEQYIKNINIFFESQRQSLLQNGTAISKANNGKVPDNPFDSSLSFSGLRSSIVKKEQVYFEKNLNDDFKLVIKHPNLFTATLKELLKYYSCFAIVRNPLAILLSWHSIQANVNNGYLPIGEAFDPNLKAELDAEENLINRQIIILRWYFSTYRDLLPNDHVITYEEIVSSGGRAIAVIDPEAALLCQPLENRNLNHLYNPSLINYLADKLISDPSIYTGYYRIEDIEDLRQKGLQ
jgi:hypothetical protein